MAEIGDLLDYAATYIAAVAICFGGRCNRERSSHCHLTPRRRRDYRDRS